MASSPETKLTPAIRRQIQADPSSPADLILRVDQATDEVQAHIEAAGFTVRRRLTLVPTFAVTGPVGAVQDLVQDAWLISVELDRPVTIQ